MYNTYYCFSYEEKYNENSKYIYFHINVYLPIIHIFICIVIYICVILIVPLSSSRVYKKRQNNLRLLNEA